MGAEGGTNPLTVLKKTCHHFLSGYAEDELLQSLEGKAKFSEWSFHSRWWESIPLDEGNGLRQSAFRVKFSEVLCLAMHLKALDRLADGLGSTTPDNCCEEVRQLTELLRP